MYTKTLITAVTKYKKSESVDKGSFSGTSDKAGTFFIPSSLLQSITALLGHILIHLFG